MKTSNDYEILEIDVQPSKDRLEDICDIKQPVFFDFENSHILEATCKTQLQNQYKAFELKVRNANDTDFSTQEIYVLLPLHQVSTLLEEDKESLYFSENNQEFLQETGVGKFLQHNDGFLRPYMVSNCNYDVLQGSSGTCTPFRYHINYRNYYLVTQGTIEIKLSPPSNSKYLQICYDYENFEFRSPVNPWKVQPEFSAEFDKMKCLDITVSAGKTVHIPAYWWYSIRFSKDSSITAFKYRTYMNNISILPQVGMHILQLQNVKRNKSQKMNIDSLRKKGDETQMTEPVIKKEDEHEEKEKSQNNNSL